jgi:ubiquinone/menaquinone biosynthesis C-methylase UbiE
VTSTFRERRLRSLLLPTLRLLERREQAIRILDIGGSANYWLPVLSDLQAMKCQILLLNRSAKEAGLESNSAEIFSFVVGDARSTGFADNSFDLVHSNSVIEHVGSWHDMEMMATEVRRLAPDYFVQVPYYWFPFETHYKALFVHWLPQQLQARLFMRFGFGGTPRKTVSGAMIKVQQTSLLDLLQFRALFPDARIARERFCGLTKSLIAIRDGSGALPGASTLALPKS